MPTHMIRANADRMCICIPSAHTPIAHENWCWAHARTNTCSRAMHSVLGRFCQSCMHTQRTRIPAGMHTHAVRLHGSEMCAAHPLRPWKMVDCQVPPKCISHEGNQSNTCVHVLHARFAARNSSDLGFHMCLRLDFLQWPGRSKAHNMLLPRVLTYVDTAGQWRMQEEDANTEATCHSIHCGCTSAHSKWPPA
eukprot:302602-Chlamydomonas_euryale.AAC.6